MEQNTDPVLTSYLIRLDVEKQRQDYLSFPGRALLNKLGMNTMVLEKRMLGAANELGSAHDWARLANLYLQNFFLNRERVLPTEFARFVSTPAPDWLHDGPPEYDVFVWINGLGRLNAPADPHFMAGAGRQFAIIPSHDRSLQRRRPGSSNS